MSNLFLLYLNVAKLMLTIRRCLNACIQKAMKETLHDSVDGDDADADDADESEKENTSVRKSTL